MEEARAIERLKGGDIGGLEMLVERHYARAAKAAYLILRDRALAEDVVQSAFVRICEKIELFDVDRPFGPWFTKIVVNDAIRASSRRERAASSYRGDVEILLSRLVDNETGPHEQAEEAEMQRRVWRALEQLPPAQRAVVVQRYYLGMSEAEMAESGATPSGTIKSRLNAARRSLKNLLRSQFRSTDSPAIREQTVPVGTPTDSTERRRK